MTLINPAPHAHDPNVETRTIAGHALTLRRGVRYVASRPFASRWRTAYPVTIQPAIPSYSRPFAVDVPAVVIEGLTYDAANALVAAFNNGPTSFDGRVW